ncbi:hypothetical protein [Sulfurospirillum arcachonense]|uniref:hypothetical protein n=1 Tax=Sulfurospirillum arcachonense TaxID=57666 RepID=UPI000468A7D0|nr:hypothetical protein [Sulfurospirillum arcachonense]
MLWKKIALSLVCASLLIGTNAPAKSDKSHKVKKEKKQKQKHLPPGLAKKVQRGGELPPGWKNKIRKGEVVDRNILEQGVLLNKTTYPKKYVDNYSNIYKIDNKIIRVMNATNEILDVLK